MSATVSPDLFISVSMKVAMALVIPLIPMLPCIIVPPPIMLVPPPIVIGLLPIIPFIKPSDASFIIAVTIPEEEVIPSILAFSIMAAIAMP